MPLSERDRLNQVIKEIENSKPKQELPEIILRKLGFNDNDLEALSTATSIFGGGLGGSSGGSSSLGMMPKYGIKNPLYVQLFKKKFGFDPKGEELVRYQQEEVPYPVSQGNRGGVFFSKKGHGGGYAASSESSVEGGPHPVETTYTPNVMYPLIRGGDFIGPEILKKEGFSHDLASTSWENLPSKLKTIVPKDTWKEARDSRSGTITLSERLALELLKSKGFDSVVSLQPTNSSSTHSIWENHLKYVNNVNAPKNLKPTWGSSSGWAYENYLTKTEQLKNLLPSKYNWVTKRLIDKVARANEKNPIKDLSKIGQQLVDHNLNSGKKFTGIDNSKIIELHTKYKAKPSKNYYPSQFIKLDRETTEGNLRKYLNSGNKGEEIYIGDGVYTSNFPKKVTSALQKLADTLYEQGQSPEWILKQGKFKNLKKVEVKKAIQPDWLLDFEAIDEFLKGSPIPDVIE